MPTIALVRDVAIIVLAVESLIIGLLLIVLIWQIRSLAKFLQEEMKPILDSVGETANTVKGTTVFLSDNFVSPLIRAASFASGARRVMGVVTRGDEKTGK